LKKTVEYFTVPSTGDRIQIRAMSADVKRQLDAMRENLPEPPTYTISYPGGETEEAPHDETTLETGEERTRWLEFVERFTEANVEVMEKWAKAVALLCIVDLEIPDGWEGDFEYVGLEVPTDERDARVFYINNVLLPSEEDKVSFGQTVMTISSIRREDLALIGAEFQSIVPWYSLEQVDIGPVEVDDITAVLRSAGDGKVERSA